MSLRFDIEAGSMDLFQGEWYENIKFCDTVDSMTEAELMIQDKKLYQYPICRVIVAGFSEGQHFSGQMSALRLIKLPREYTCYHRGPDGEDFREQCYLKDDVIRILNTAGLQSK
jgi:hypothetical protein